jgi:hypothetical protein
VNEFKDNFIYSKKHLMKDEMTNNRFSFGSSKNSRCGAWWCMPASPATWEAEVEHCSPKPVQAKAQTLSDKQTKNKRTGAST